MNRSIPPCALPRRACLAVAVAVACLAGLPGRALAVSFTLDYSQINVLPSATGQGMTYITTGIPESTAFSVSGGALKLNTTPFGDSAALFYDFAGGYNDSLDTRLTVRLKVDSPSNGLFIGFYSPTRVGLLNVTSTSWTFSGLGGAISFASGFREFDINVSGLTKNYTVKIDGVQVTASQLGANSSSISQMYFGDGTGFASTNASISYLRYVNENAPVVPEPSSLVLVGIGGFVVALAGRRARARASAN